MIYIQFSVQHANIFQEYCDKHFSIYHTIDDDISSFFIFTVFKGLSTLITTTKDNMLLMWSLNAQGISACDCDRFEVFYECAF